jgi:hypothetical protein
LGQGRNGFRLYCLENDDIRRLSEEILSDIRDKVVSNLTVPKFGIELCFPVVIFPSQWAYRATLDHRRKGVGNRSRPTGCSSENFIVATNPTSNVTRCTVKFQDLGGSYHIQGLPRLQFRAKNRESNDMGSRTTVVRVGKGYEMGSIYKVSSHEGSHRNEKSHYSNSISEWTKVKVRRSRPKCIVFWERASVHRYRGVAIW